MRCWILRKLVDDGVAVSNFNDDMIEEAMSVDTLRDSDQIYLEMRKRTCNHRGWDIFIVM